MKLKSLLTLAVCASSLLALAATSTPKGFTDDLDAALTEAKTSGKYVYACFSGSDWCGWCKKLEKEVFSDKTMDFVGALKDDYLFVFIDSPQNQDLLSEAAKKRNPKLVSKYDIHGFPTALILNGKGETIDQTGYRKGGAKAYVAYLKNVRKNGPKLAAQKKREGEIEAKYFGNAEKKLMGIIAPLQSGAVDAQAIEKVAADLEAYAKTLETMKIAKEDLELAGPKRDEAVTQVRGIVKQLKNALAQVKQAELQSQEKTLGQKDAGKKTGKKTGEAKK